MSRDFDAEDKTLVALFESKKPYRVPAYQRPYSWTEDEVQEFWDDLIRTDDADFIGSLIFNYEHVDTEGVIDIIDGQQRIITITLFVAALRDVAKTFAEDGKRLAVQIHAAYIASTDWRGNDAFRLVPAESIATFLSAFQQYAGPFDEKGALVSKAETEEQKRLLRNYISLRKKIESHVHLVTAATDRLDRIVAILEALSSIRIIHIQIWNEVEAYQIFETVNARGVDLSVADLLKNLVFKKVADKNGRPPREVLESWKDMEVKVRDAEFEISKFVRYFWLSRHDFVIEKQLFKKIRDSVTDFRKLLDDLNSASADLRLLVVATRDEWEQLEIRDNVKWFKAIRGLRSMNVSQCFVFFMAILRNYDRLGTNPYWIVLLIEKFHFKYSLVCKLPTNRIERLYSSKARELQRTVDEVGDDKERAARVQTVFNALATELKELTPTEEEFQRKFAEIEYGNTEKDRRAVKYILGRMNEFYSTGEQEIDYSVVNIEHVLPQKPSNEWNLTVSEIEAYVDLLGNLTLVHKKINSKAGNKGISSKLSDLEASQIRMTEELVSEIRDGGLRWGEMEIVARQVRLGGRAFHEVWRY